jgi:pSer/pThr/pTyr-binding forkhead associated (FHA) protein
MATRLVLKATGGDLGGREFVFTGHTHLILGRSRSCTLRLPGDATVSRQHCLIEIDPTGIWVQDLGSLNGTHINGQKIGQRDAARDNDQTMMQPPRQGLRDGDELRICSNVFRVGVHETTAQPSRAPEHTGLSSGSGLWATACCL